MAARVFNNSVIGKYTEIDKNSDVIESVIG